MSSLSSVGIYLACVALYYYTVHAGKWDNVPEETVRTAIIKGLPLTVLMLLVVSTKSQGSQHNCLKNNILIGQIFSLVGDLALVWRIQLFIPGLLSFAIAHCFYTRAFLFKPFGAEPATLCFVSGLVMYMFFLPVISELELKIMVFVYITLIFTMWWRSIVRWQERPNIGTLCGCLGAFVFLVSDFMIAIDKWHFHTTYNTETVMATYYTAQLGIALSVALYNPMSDEDRKIKQG